MKTPSTLIIMDGYGLGDAATGNAIKAANTPNLDRLFAECSHSRLAASGLDVGLPRGQIGNSEVGHTNIGAGRVVFQDLPRITLAIEDGSFFKNPAFLDAMRACRKGGGALHLMGLLSDGGVHSHITHLWAFLRMAKQEGLTRVYLHCFLDGRDVSPTSGAGFISDCVRTCGELGVGRIATVMGRYYAMDRDNRWDRVEQAYAAMVYGEGIQNPDPEDAVRASYASGVTDEFVKPVVCLKEGTISPGDSVIFTNFRPDRAREITRALVDPAFSHFPRKKGFFPLCFVCLTEYDAAMPNIQVAYCHEPLENIFGEYISRLGLTQVRIAETEKYAHVTFFFNGGREEPFEGEDRILIPSPKVATYDLKPEMSAHEVADAAVRSISSGKYDVVIVNFANCDMVGHTGVFDAARRAVEAVDECVGRVVAATADMGGITILTADHGNAESMLEPDGVSPMTAHTTNPVPFLIHGVRAPVRNGRLADIAPTLLDVLGLKKPSEMDGETLIVTSHASKSEKE
ncbi:2,3-bisphosphoglycerate-independent phosphoglycerate mutase [Papillibacter cinnamivorans]|uniref:2,3-bisphosphoglycerate-independent phosphoglycerate mutase n=1 Tax=Papillibacter cinnamivorans DSM 12816 TaxID=1122930 RepID=A0A1W2A6N3_9FIRM|nr:2,3-bisphosphoglycerate-independent phosphoglycerate mutase [Papillibacter cinnamivorans]SMC56344.1 phosphoglycerate mutase [Papillibacter cinnamivorans DSM 12816]